MKRSKFILLALVAALVLMGAGYAAWTQTFTIDNNITTGELFIKVEQVQSGNKILVYNETDNKYVDLPENHYLGNILDFAVGKESGEKNREGQSTLESLSCTIEQMHPGTKLIHTLKFTNLGTVKATTKAISKSGENDEIAPETGHMPLWNDMILTVRKIKGDHEESRVIGQDTTGIDKFNSFKNALAWAVGDLDVGENVTVVIEQELPESSDNQTENIKNLVWKVILQFEQAFD